MTAKFGRYFLVKIAVCTVKLRSLADLELVIMIPQ